MITEQNITDQFALMTTVLFKMVQEFVGQAKDQAIADLIGQMKNPDLIHQPAKQATVQTVAQSFANRDEAEEVGVCEVISLDVTDEDRRPQVSLEERGMSVTYL